MEKNKLSILLVEDNPADVLFLREALAQDALADFELTVVESLTSAREALPKQTFHASLLDLGLPDSNGLDTFLKLHRSAPELPVVVLSALDDEEVAMQSMQAGAQDYLVKRPQDFPSAGRALRYAIERNQTEKKLRESEKLFVTMFHSNPMPTGITQVDDYRIIDVNKAWTKLTGYTREEAVGHTSIELGLARPETLQRVRGILDVQTTISENEILLYTRAGQERQMLISTETIQLGGEKYFLTNLQDITERKQNEKLIRQWADAFENCAHGIAIGLPATNQVLTCNPTFAQLQGRTVAEISSMPILSMYAPEDHEHVIKNIMEADLKGSVRYEAHMVRKDGTRYPVQMDVISVRDETGNILYRVATQQDITERKQAERELRESEQRFAKLFSSNPSAVVVVTMDGRYVDVNQAYLDLVGMTREDLLGHPDVAAEALRNEEWLMFADLSRTYGGGLRNKEMWLPVRDGHRHVLVSMETIIIGNMPHRMIAINDITELKQTEEALKAEQLRFSQVAATVPGVITALCVQPDGQVTLLYASLAFEDVFGLEMTDLNSNTLAIIQRIAPEEVQKILAQLTELAATLEPVYFEFRYQHPLKGEIWLENRAQPVREADGSVIWYGVTSDITERKQAEQKLHESERRYRELFENTNSGVAVYQVVDEGRDFIFKDFNRAGEKIDNDRRERLIGRSILEMRPGLKEFGLLEAMRQVWQSGQAVFLPATHYKDDRLDAWYENFIYCISPNEIATVFENITERKQAEEILRMSEERQTLLLSLSDALRTVSDPVEIQEIVSRSALKYFKADRCYYCEIIGDEALIRRDASRDDLPSVAGSYRMSDFPIFKAVVDARQPFTVENIHTTNLLDESLRQLCIQLQLASFIDVPVIKNGEPVGILCITQCMEREWTDFEIELGREIADRAWLAVERAQTAKQLRESEERARAMLNAIPDMMFRVDRSGTFLDYKADVKDLHEQSGALIGRRNREVTPPEFADLIEGKIAETLASGQVQTFEYQLPVPDTGMLDFEARMAPSGQDEVIAIVRNITKRKQAEEKLRSSENKYHQLFEAAPIGIILANLHGEILEVNPAVVQILGSPSAEATKAINMLTFPLLIEAGISADFKKTIDLQQTHANEYPYITKWGKSIHIFARFTPLLDTHGTLDRVQILFEDITERKQAESQSEAALEKLRESEERLGLVMEGSQLGYWDWDIETGKVYRNARWAEMLGYTLEEVEFSVKQWSDLHHLDDHESAMKSIQDHLDGKTPAHRIEYRMRAKDGSYKWILDQARVVKRDANGKPLRMSGTHTDITERKQQELQQADEQKILEMLVKGEALSTILEALTGHIESQFPNISCSILLLDSDGLHMHQRAGQNIPQSYVAAIDGLQIGPAAGSCGTAAYRKTPVYVADIASDPLWINYREIALKHGFRACWSMPILATNSTVLGTFAIYSQEPRTPGTIETSLLTTAARLASIAVERKQSEESLHESERRYTTLFQKSGVPVILLKLPEVTMVDVNEAAEELTGYGREELLGKTTVELGIINEQQRNQSIARFEAEGTLAQNEMRIFTKAGQERILIIDTHPIEINKQPFAFVAMQDVTRQKRAEESLKQRLEDLALINTLNEAVNHGEDISRVTQLIASETKKIFGSDYASVYLINPERTLVSLQHFTMTGDPIEKLEKLIGRPLPQIDLPLGGDDHFNQVLRSDHGILFTGFNAINRWLTDFANTTFLSSKVRSLMRKLIPVAAKQLNIHSVISIPLKAGEEALGLIEFASEGTFDESVLERLQNIRHQLAEVILRKRTEQSLRESEEKYRLLAEELEERVKQRTAEVQDLYDNAPAGYHSLDANGCFIRINKTELTWLGYSLEEVIGRPFADFVTPAGLATFKKNFAAFKQRGLLNELEMEFRRKDGTVFQTLVNATAIKDENGNYITSRSTVFDITDRKQAEETIKASETKYRQLFENMTEGFSLNEIITDENEQPVNFRILDANEAYGRHNGLQTRDVIGKTILEIIPAADLRQIETCGKVAQTGEPLEYEYYSQALNRHFSVRAFSPRRGQFATLFEDITVRKLAEDALRKNRDRLDLANKQLERAMKVKDEFLANMSHELRTPLNGILGMSEILLEGIRGPLNERQQTMVKIIEDSGRHLLSLINDILDLSKIEAEKFDLIMENVAVEEICQICLSFIKEPAMKKGVAVNYHPDPAITFLQADPKRLKQILVNLLSNAVKFTLPEGKVSLTVTADVEKNSCRFLVSDTGIGIAPEDMHKLFQPFSQIDSSLTRHYEGSGLGLSLVKRLTELHGGVVSVTSEVGRGSHFVVTLPWKPDPVHTSQSMQVVADTPPVNTAEGRKNLILVAEDNEANNMIFDDYLTSKGYEVISARDGREALEKALAASPDLILMDVQMPEIDGLEVIRRLRATPQFSTTPIIAVTAHAMAGDDEKCLEAGATAYMSKPVKLEEMVNRIKKYLRL